MEMKIVVGAGKTCAADYASSPLNAGLMAAPPLHLPNLFLINYESATERHKIARTHASLIMKLTPSKPFCVK